MHTHSHLVAVNLTSHTLQLWDIETGECRACITDSISSIFSLACAQGRMLFYGRQDCQVRLVDLTPLATVPPQRITLTGHVGYVFALALCKNVLYSASGDGNIIVRTSTIPIVAINAPAQAWDTAKLTKIGALEGHRATVFTLAVWESELYSGSKVRSLHCLHP